MAELNLRFLQTLEDEQDILRALIHAIEEQQQTTRHCQQTTHNSIAAVRSDLLNLQHILIGVDGTNGLRAKMKDEHSETKALRQRIETLEKWRTQAMVLFVVVQVIIVPLLGTLLKKVFFP